MLNVKVSPIDNTFTACLWQVIDRKGVVVFAGINASRQSAIEAAFAARASLAKDCKAN